MDEPYRSPAHDPGSGYGYGSDDRVSPTGHTEAFETEPFETRELGAPSAETRQFPPRPAQQPFHRPYEPGPQHPALRPPMGYEPLAHEGGLPYGNPPAPAYPPHQQFVPQHLAVPPQFGPGPYPPHLHQQYPQPYMYPPQHIQQTVVMNNKRGVNHVLHLVLTLLTAGLWLPVWIILAIANS